MTLTEIFNREKHDCFFILYNRKAPDQAMLERIIKEHNDFFDKHELTTEHCVPDEMVTASDAEWYYVNFTGFEDPRLKEYGAYFEDEQGRSLYVEYYQLQFAHYNEWIQQQGILS